MTVVVGIRHRDGVVLAADSLLTLSDGGAVRYMRGPKTLKLSDTVALAGCGSPRLTQVIEYAVKLDDETEPHLGQDEHRWAVTVFVPLVQEALARAGYLHRWLDDSVESLGASGLILAVRDRVFSLVDDFEVNEDLVPWVVDGSGWENAAGHFVSLGWTVDTGEEELDIQPAQAETEAITAVEVAVKLNAYVDGRVTTEHTVRLTDDEKTFLKTIH